MKDKRNLDSVLNDLRGRRTMTEEQIAWLLTLAITLNRYAQQPWYKKIRRIYGK